MSNPENPTYTHPGDHHGYHGCGKYGPSTKQKETDECDDWSYKIELPLGGEAPERAEPFWADDPVEGERDRSDDEIWLTDPTGCLQDYDSCCYDER